MYKLLIRPLLFLMEPEKAHYFTFGMLKTLGRIPGVKALFRQLFTLRDKRLSQVVFGLRFENPVGLAAGFDKDARLVDELADLGFGFIEIGTLTPKAQPGNEQPRLFRLPADQGLINRMGFNNGGVEEAVVRLRQRKSQVLIGGNIGKNKVTENEQAYTDYEKCFDALYPVVDYFVVNVSSPNTPNLRALQEKEPLKQLLLAVQERNVATASPKPILLKIAPDLTSEQLDDIIDIVKVTQIAGVIATNTTISREGLNTPASALTSIGAGGLSGKPVRDRSTEVVRYLHEQSKGAFPIIAVGGIFTGKDALEKLQAGASLVQVYTGFIYEGPSMVKAINRYLLKHWAK